MGKPVWKRCTHYFLIIEALKNKIIFSVVLIFFCQLSILAQEGFKDRLGGIKEQLELLAEADVKGLNGDVNFAVASAPIQDFLKSIAETHELNIHIDPGLSLKVTNNFTNAKVKDVLYFVCAEYKVDIRFVNNIMSFFPYKPPVEKPKTYVEKQLKINYDKAGDLLSYDLKRDSLSLFVKQTTQKTDKNIILSPGLDQLVVSGFVRNMNFEQALGNLAYANGLASSVTDQGTYILEKELKVTGNAASNAGGRRGGGSAAGNNNRSGAKISVEVIVQNNDTLISVTAFNSPIIDIISEVSEKMNKSYILFSQPEGVTTTVVNEITYDDLIHYLLQGTNHTHTVEDGIYLIGDRIQEGFRKTKLVKLQFRVVTEIEKSIPEELIKGVQIKIFPELNAIILSGGAPQIDEIESFIKAIDEPVPNILIEVIVVDVQKGFNIQTGISAMLSDSAVTTQGQVFPGLDLTISSNSINNALEKLNSKGIVNLGRVTPRFYTTLRALEDNNNLEIKSTPKLSTLNGHEANLTIGRSVYYVQETQNINPGVNPITTVSQQFRQVEANLQIKIFPVVSGNEHITLAIEAEFSDFINPEIEGAPPGNATRKFNSQIRVVNEEMIVLGGLEEDRESETSSGVPLLSRIPVLKWLFSSKSKTKDKDQLLVFIKPTIVY